MKRLIYLYLVALLFASAAPASADVVRNKNIAFAGVRMNPWTSDPEFGFNDSGSIFNTGQFYLPFPTRIEGNPTQAAINALSDLLGIPLPISASVGFGGSVSGSVGLDWAYEVTGGRLHMNYPAHTGLRVSTNSNSRVQPRVNSTITTTFQPGITQASPTSNILATLAGLGYSEEMALDGGTGAGAGGSLQTLFSFNQFTTPTFATEAPWASASIKAHANLEAGVGVHARACFIFCVSHHEELKFGSGAQEWNIVEVDPTQIYTPFGNYDLDDLVEEIDLGEVAELTLSVPKIAVGGNPTAPGSPILHGTASKPIATVKFDLERYIPVIGEYLDGTIGPFKYHLLSLDAGPQLSLYQDLTFTPQPKVQLKFSEEVMIRGADGVYRPGRSVTTPLGESVEWRPVFSPNSTVGIQPTYIMDNTFTNKTGFDVGIEFELKTLEVETPIGDLGPVCCDPVSFSLLRAQFYENTFTLPMPPVPAAEIVLEKDNALGMFSTLDEARLTSSILTNRNLLTGTATYQIAGIFSRWNPNWGHPDSPLYFHTPFNFAVTGVETSYLPSPEDNRIYFLSTDEDVMQSVDGQFLNLGRDFRLGFDDLIGTQWYDPPNPVYVDEVTGHELLLADLSTFRLDEVDVDTHPTLGFQNQFDQQTVAPPEIGPTVTDDLRDGSFVLSHVESYEEVPEGGGGFASFEAPVINSAGQVAYRAGLYDTPGNAGDQEGIYLTDDDGTVKLVRGGDPAAAGPGEIHLTENTRLALSESGQLTSHLGIQGGGGEGGASGIFRSDGVDVTEVARRGSPSPDADGTYSTLTEVTANESGQAAFIAVVQQPDSGSYEGVFRDDGTTTDVIARTDQIPSGLDHPIGGFADPSINATGQVAFSARFADASIFGAQGIYVGDGESLTTIAIGRITSPQTGEFNNLYGFMLNNAGQVAFSADGQAGAGIHRGDGTQTTTIAHQGEIAPGAAGTFLGFLDPHINDPGQVAFAAQTFNGASYGSGIFRSDGSGLTAIAVSNQSPDNADGSFDYTSFFDPSGRDFALNNHGHVAFVGSLNVENGSVGGLFLHDGTHLLEIARTGRPFQGSTIQGFYLATGSDTEDGLNDSMQIAYTAILADGRHMVARFEPITLWKNAASGDWDTDENWSLGVQPTAPYDAAIIREDAVTITGPVTNRIVRSLIVGGYGQNVNTLRLDSGDIHATQRVALAGNAELVLAGGRTLTTPQLENSGLIRGTGTIVGNVTNRGMIAPGNSPGTLTINGDYMQDAAGTLVIELASGGHDQLAVSGDVSLGGAIAVSLLGGFLPTLGQSFPIINSLTAALSGTFADVDFPTFSGLTFDVNYTTDSAVLEVVVAPALPGDFNSDGYVDAADYVAWRKGVGTIPGDYDDWRANFGESLGTGAGEAFRSDESVPEPMALALLPIVAILVMRPRRRT